MLKLGFEYPHLRLKQKQKARRHLLNVRLPLITFNPLFGGAMFRKKKAVPFLLGRIQIPLRWS